MLPHSVDALIWVKASIRLKKSKAAVNCSAVFAV